ncbi:MAG TPA: CHRD domain-containing protein [Thermoleophilaceae bacterium]
MRIRIARLVALSALAALAGALFVAGPVGAHGKRHAKRHHAKVLQAKLKGANEVPGPGDSDARGKAVVRVNPKAGKVCFRLRWKNIAEPPTMAHIHKGAKGVAGPIVVALFDGTAVHKGCVSGLDKAVLKDIKKHPRQYYVNIHNSEFPNGAMRGQLKKSGHHRARHRHAVKHRRHGARRHARRHA